MSLIRKSVMAVYSTYRDLVEFANYSLYDTFISNPMTTFTYEKFAERLNQAPNFEKEVKILDVGVGTGVPLSQVLNQFPSNSSVLGIDIDHSYLSKASKIFKNNPRVEIKEIDFYKMDPNINGKFEVIIFSQSFMLLDKQEEALNLAKSLLQEGGSIFFIVTLNDKPILGQIRDKIKYLTSIDFQIQRETEFENMLQNANLETVFKERLKKIANFHTNLLRVFIYETKLNIIN